jgi:hypothetical protein
VDLPAQEDPGEEAEEGEQQINRGILMLNWLRVLDTAKLSQVDQRIGQQFHPIVPLLTVLEP